MIYIYIRTFVLKRRFTGNEYELGVITARCVHNGGFPLYHHRFNHVWYREVLGWNKEIVVFRKDSLKPDPIQSVILKTRMRIKGFRKLKCILHHVLYILLWFRRLIHFDPMFKSRPSMMPLLVHTAASYKVSKKLSGFSSNPFCQQLLDVNGSPKSSRGKSGSLSG